MYKKTLVISVVFLAINLLVSSCSCSSNTVCPDGMKECEINTGETICIPDDLSCS